MYEFLAFSLSCSFNYNVVLYYSFIYGFFKTLPNINECLAYKRLAFSKSCSSAII